MWEGSPELDASTSACVAEHQITLFMTLYDMTLLYLFLMTFLFLDLFFFKENSRR